MTNSRFILLLLVSYAIHDADGRCSISTVKRLVKQQMKAIDATLGTLAYGGKKGSSNGVAFYATVTVTKNFGKNRWIFDRVETNIGNAYKPGTGTFIAPENGVFAFNWSTLNTKGNHSYGYLSVNGAVKGKQACDLRNAHNLNTCSNTVVLSLKKNDEVYISEGKHTSHVIGTFTSFAGWKLF